MNFRVNIDLKRENQLSIEKLLSTKNDLHILDKFPCRRNSGKIKYVKDLRYLNRIGKRIEIETEKEKNDIGNEFGIKAQCLRNCVLKNSEFENVYRIS